MRNAMVDGPVNIVAGLIQMDGGSIAFPEATDKEAEKFNVHLHAIIKGAKYDLHVALGKTINGIVNFNVPANTGNTIVLGILKHAFTLDIFELAPDLIGNGARRANSFELAIDLRSLKSRKIRTFTNRL